MIDSILVIRFLVWGAVILLGWSAVAALLKTDLFAPLLVKWRGMSRFQKGMVVSVLLAVTAWAGDKPGVGGDGGDDTGGSSTNDVTQVEGDASNTNGVGWIDGDADGTNDVGGVMTLGMFGGVPTQGETGGEDDDTEPEVPTNAPISHLSRITHSMCAAGFAIQGLGTNETFDFSAPEGALVATNWMLHGAANARMHTDLKDWTFPFGDDFVTNLAAFANGVVMPDVSDANRCFMPFSAPLGVPPEANWDELDETNRPSIYWQTMAEDNAVICTWQNVLLDRAPTNPVSFQVEFRPGGSFIYRYDLSRLASDELLTNVTVGVKNGNGEWFAPRVGRSLTSLKFARVTMADIDDPDRDGDGIPTEVELFDLGTDPDNADTDFDGLPDGREIEAGLDPRNRDSDGDGLVDAADPDPQTANGNADDDHDGINDDYERHWFGDTNVVDDAVSRNEGGFSLETEILAGINPTNDAPTAATYITNSLVSWKLFDSFAAQFPNAGGVVWQRAFRIGKTSPWQQYFVSAAPDFAAGWMLEGMRLEWEDSNGNSGSVVRSPSGDSWRIPLSTNETESVTLRLRATGSQVRTATPLYLVAYVPEFKMRGGMEITGADGTHYSVYINGSESVMPLGIDWSKRPCRAEVGPDEYDMGVFERMAEETGDFAFEGDWRGGDIYAYRPGVYRFPDISAKMSPPVRARRLLGGSGGGGHEIVILDPSVGWDCNGDGCSSDGLDYDWADDWYYEESDYPLDSSCLRSRWHHGYGGGWWCDGSFYCSSGIGECDGVTTETEGNTGTVCVGGVPVWSDSAEHVHDHACGDDGSLEVESVGCCGDCRNGNCDSMEGPEAGSLKFRIPLGSPADGFVSGFAYFETEDPITITKSIFRLKMHPDARYDETTENGVRSVICNDRHGRTLLIEDVSEGVRITIRTTETQALEHTWEITNVGSSSVIRLRKISRLDNVMQDETYRCEEGDWVRFDNIAQIREEVSIEGGVNDPDSDWTKREIRTTYDADGNRLSQVVTDMKRVGECDNAVLREVYRSEDTGYNWRETRTEYWDDPQHPRRHGKVRLRYGNDAPWRYADYDEYGRMTVRVEQRNGSECNVEMWEYEIAAMVDWENGGMLRTGVRINGLEDAFLTICDYAPMAGDDAHVDDAALPRTETKYVVTGGVATLIGRTWRRYTRLSLGLYDAVKVETWRAANAESAATLNSSLLTLNSACAYSYEVTFADSGDEAPLAMRGAVVESLDENGLLTENDYTVSGNVVTCTSRKSYGSNAHPTYTVTETDADYGNVLRSATYLTDGDVLLAEERSTYDDQNRLRSTTYSDGTSLTNSYSCCRLLWKRDREGRKTLRSGVTGTDHLYNAEEEVWLADISTNGGYRVTQHFFDALGRETNTTTCIGFTPGEYAVPSAPSRTGVGQPVASETTVYPNGGSDLAVRTDGRGVETIRRTNLVAGGTETDEEVLTNGVRVTLTTTRTVFGGGTTTRREWSVATAPSPSSLLWTEETRFTDYASDGRRIDYAVTVSSDCGTVTNSIVAYDWLGREVSRSVPGANDSRIETRRFYDGASERIIRAETDGSPDVTYGYDVRGELETTTQSGILNRSVTTYETVSGEVWQVRTSTKETGSTVNSTSIDRIQLTGLSDALRSRRESVSPSNVTRRESAFDPSGYLTTTTTVDDGTPETSVSRCGLEVSATTLDGTETYEYDEQGRRVSVSSFAAGATSPRSREIVHYNAFGDPVETMSDYGADGSATATAAYDLFGREVARTDAQGNTVTTEYDALGRVISTSGDAYPIQSGYDSTGRKTRGATTRDGGNTWDETSWTYDPASGLNTAKRYADGSQIAYAYTDNGKKRRTTWARGAWKESAYDSDNRVSGVTYSDGTPTVQYAYNAAGMVVEAATAGGAQFGYAYDDRLLCTNETFGIGPDYFEVARDYDANRRAVRTSVIVTNVAHAVKSRWFDSENRVAGYALTNSLGRGVTATLAYDGSRMSGMTFVLPNGGTFSTALTRNAARPDLVTRRAYSANGSSIYSYDTTFDLLGCPVNATDSQSLARSYLYNRRSELAAATIGTNAYEYAYDTIGNRTVASANSVTNTYAANNLNQYTQIDASQLTYDNDGNLTQDDRFAYTYDAENRLVTVRSISPTEGALAVVNAYDYKHRRVAKRVERFDGEAWQMVETHTFVYDGGNIVLEKIASPDGTTRTVEYFWGNDLSGGEQGAGGVGGLLAVSIDGLFYFPCYDQNGNVVCYVSETGAIAAQFVFDPYGNVIDQYGNMPDQFAFGFSTKYLDRETGLVGYQRRFYRPDHGRWLNRDPIEEDGGENLYAFCENSPLGYIDAFGFQIVVIRHFAGKSPPGGWGDGGRNRGQTHYKEPDISCKEVKKGKGKIGFAVSIDPPITIINVYFREEESLGVTSNNENQHIALYIILDNAIENFKRVAEDIVECPDEAYRLLDIAYKNLQKVRVYVAAENNRLDAPGGPHGH